MVPDFLKLQIQTSYRKIGSGSLIVPIFYAVKVTEKYDSVLIGITIVIPTSRRGPYKCPSSLNPAGCVFKTIVGHPRIRGLVIKPVERQDIWDTQYVIVRADTEAWHLALRLVASQPLQERHFHHQQALKITQKNFKKSFFFLLYLTAVSLMAKRGG